MQTLLFCTLYVQNKRVKLIVISLWLIEMTTKSFKELIVWQKSMKLSLLVYKITKNFDADEKFGLTSQMRRCAVSIPSNIAEGSKRGTNKDFRYFLYIANGSAAELETQILIAKRLYENLDFNDSIDLLIEVQKMLAVFINKMK